MSHQKTSQAIITSEAIATAADAEPFINGARVGEILGVSPATVQRMTRARMIGSYRFGRSRRYLESEIRRQVAQSLRVRAITEK